MVRDHIVKEITNEPVKYDEIQQLADKEGNESYVTKDTALREAFDAVGKSMAVLHQHIRGSKWYHKNEKVATDFAQLPWNTSIEFVPTSDNKYVVRVGEEEWYIVNKSQKKKLQAYRTLWHPAAPILMAAFPPHAEWIAGKLMTDTTAMEMHHRSVLTLDTIVAHGNALSDAIRFLWTLPK